MSCIGWDRDLDPDLHDLYAKKLLEPGWAGEVDDAEAAYIAKKLTDSPALRRLWRVSEFTRRRKAITQAMARSLARWWAEMSLNEDEAAFSDTVDGDIRRYVKKNYVSSGGRKGSQAER